MKSIYTLILLFGAVVALSSCSAERERVKATAEDSEIEVVEEQVSSPESDPRTPIYVYQKHPEQVSTREVILRLNAEPLLLASGYVRLVGVVSGGRPLALVEVGGKGRGVGKGEELAGYRIAWISPKKVGLEKEREE